MKNSFNNILESEKNRILEMHSNRKIIYEKTDDYCKSVMSLLNAIVGENFLKSFPQDIKFEDTIIPGQIYKFFHTQDGVIRQKVVNCIDQYYVENGKRAPRSIILITDKGTGDRRVYEIKIK